LLPVQEAHDEPDAEQRLDLALRSLDPGVVLEELRRPNGFVVRCRQSAALAQGDERSAWLVLAGIVPAAIRDQLERTGLAASGLRTGGTVVALRPRRPGFGNPETAREIGPTEVVCPAGSDRAEAA